MNKPEFLKVTELSKSYPEGDGGVLTILSKVSLAIPQGEFRALLGPSGSGKSTLLHLVGLLDQGDSGQIMLDGLGCSGLSEVQRTRVRRDSIGFIYQFHHLLPEFTALENVMMPGLIRQSNKKTLEIEAKKLLDRLGLSHRLSHRPVYLSGGEQQRVAIARALINKPKLLLADEPTGNLDAQTSQNVFEALLDCAQAYSLTALIATHNTDLASRMNGRFRLEKGMLINESV